MRFFYLRNPEDEDQGIGQLAVNHFKVNVFGSRASSFIFAAVLQHHLQKYIMEHTALDIGRKILVDNLVTRFKKHQGTFANGLPNMMNHVEYQRIAGKRDTHVLGLLWTTKEDQLSLKLFKQQSEAVGTKGKIFSQFVTLFDLFGWTAPATIKAKLFMRDLWKERWAWDEELPKQMKEEWKTIGADLAIETTFVRPRHIPITEKNHLDIFVESSLSAYAAVAYLNEELYMAKTRFAPVSPKTIPETRVDGNCLRLTARKIVTTNSSTSAHRGRNNILERFTSLPGLAQVNQDTENFCSEPSEHDQQLQM